MDSIIFDVDGTLWNSTGIVADSWTAYLQQKEHLNITVTSELLISLFGRPMPEIARNVFSGHPESEQMRLLDACCNAEHEALLAKCAPLYEDLDKVIRLLSEKYDLYIVSNCQSGYIEVFLKTSGLEKYFKGHICNGDNGLEKADNIRLIADTYHLQSPVYVGDTLGDYEACRKAQIPFILAEYGFGDAPDPHARISKPMDLLNITDL